MQDLDPIEIEVAMKVAKAIDDSQNLDTSLKDLDKSVENVKKKFKQKTEELNRNTQAKKTQTQTTQQQTEATQKQTQATNQQNEALNKNTQKFNALEASVNQITRELPAFTYSAQTGFMAIANNIPILTDAMAKLRAENEKLKASGQKTTPVWKQLVSSFFSWGTALSVGITLLTVYGKEIGEFFASLGKGKTTINEKTEAMSALNEAMQSEPVKGAVKNILSLEQSVNLAKKGVLSKKEAVDEFNQTLGDTVGKLKTYDELEKWMDDNKERYLKMMLYKTAANKMLEKATDELIRKQEAETKTAVENANTWDTIVAFAKGKLKGYEAPDLLTLHNRGEATRQKTIDDATKKQKAYEKVSADFIEKLKELEAQAGFSITKKDDGGTQKLENEYKKLLEKIGELDKEYSTKSFDKHDAEIQALKEKFAKVRKLVEDFNKNPKNNLKIGLSDFNSLESKAVETLKYRHETENLKKELGKQKELFTEYEAYKTKVGGEEADRRFKNELKGFSSYTHLLETLIRKTKENDPDSPERSERLRELQTQLLLANEAENKRERNKFADLLEQYKGFNEKRLALDNQYYDDIAILEQQRNEANADAVDEAIKMRKAKYGEDLNNLQATILQSSDFYTKLFSDLSKKGYRTLRDFAQYTMEVLNSAKTYNTTGGKTMVRVEFDQIDEQGEKVKRVSNITVAEFERIKAKANEMNRLLSDKNPFEGVVQSFQELQQAVKEGNTDAFSESIENLSQTANSSVSIFKKWGDSLGKVFGKGVSEATDNIGNLVGGVVDVGTGIAKLYSGDIVGGITSSLSGITSIFNAINSWQEKAKAQQAKMIVADIEALRLIREKNYALRESVQYLSAYRHQQELLLKLQEQGVIAQDGMSNKYIEDMRKYKELIALQEREVDVRNGLWSNLTNSKWSTTERHGSASKSSTSGFLSNDLETMKRQTLAEIEKLERERQHGAANIQRRNLNLLNEANNVETYVRLLNQRGWLSGEAKELYEAWERSGKSLEEYTKKFQDLTEQMRVAVMGENFDAFVNNFATALAKSQGNVAQFAEYTEDKIKTALFNSFKYQFLAEQLKPLYEDMSEVLNQGVDNLDENKVNQIAQQFNQVFRTSSKKLENLSKQLGTNLYDENAQQTSHNSLKGAVKGITEQQADLLAGQFGGLRLAQLETNKINKQGFAETMAQTSKMIGIQLEIQHNTRRTADNTDAMKESLKNIETSVKSNKNDLKGNGIKP